MSDDAPQLQRQVRRKARPYLIVVCLVAAAFVAWRCSQPQVVVVSDRDAVMQYLPGTPEYTIRGTFKTENLEAQRNAFLSIGSGHTGVGSTTAPTYTGSASYWFEGYSTTDTDLVTIDDIVNNHANDFNTVTIHNSGTLDTSSSDRNAIGLRIVMDPLPTSGAHLLNNAGITIDTNNGDTNEAIHVIHGTARFNEDLIAGPTTVSTLHTTGNADINSIITFNASTGDTLIPGLLTLSNTTSSLWAKGRAFIGGTTIGDTVYISGGSINFGFGNNATDKLHINFTGYNGGFTQFRDIEFDDGEGNEAMYLTGSTKSLKIDGGFDVVGLVGTINQFHVAANGVQINTFSGTLAQPVIRAFVGDPNGTVTGGIGSLVMDTSGPFLWQNTNGATAWQKIGGFTTGGSVYFGDGNDGTCNFDGVTTPVCGGTLSGSTYTLQRDIAPLNMTVAAGTTVRTDNWRVFVYNTLTGGGAGATVSNSGFPAAARIPGNCGGINSHFYPACGGNGGAGANGPGAGNNGNNNSSSIPQMPAQSAAAAGAAGAGHGQGGGGGTTGANAGGTGGSISICGVNCGLFTAVSGFTGKPDGSGTLFSLYGTGGGGGGCVGGSCTGGGGGGGGGILYVGANQCVGTIVLRSDGGNADVGALVGGSGAGGGGGGGGGVIDFIYSHRAATCTTSVAAGTGAAGTGTGAAGGNGSTGVAYTVNLSGDGT